MSIILISYLQLLIIRVWSRVSLSVASLKVLCDKVSLSNSQTPQPVTTPTSPVRPILFTV